jgi:hypothetical protein
MRIEKAEKTVVVLELDLGGNILPLGLVRENGLSAAAEVRSFSPLRRIKQASARRG